jgi:hypothetical protein
MQTQVVLKLNIAGTGYEHLWLHSSPLVDEQTIDSSLPQLDNRSSGICVAYSATRLSGNRVFLAVGSYWPQLKDEFGRRGLAFWHAIVCQLTEHLDNEIVELSDLLIGLVRNHEIAHDQIGEIVANIAQMPNAKDQIDTIVRLGSQSRPTTNSSVTEIVERFTRNLKQVPNQANLRTSFPFDPDLSIACLFALMYYRSDDVGRIGGGAISRSELERCQFISVEADVLNYPIVSVNDFVNPKSTKTASNAVPTLAVAVAILCCSLFSFSSGLIMPELIRTRSFGSTATLTTTTSPIIAPLPSLTLTLPSTRTPTNSPTPTPTHSGSGS